MLKRSNNAEMQHFNIRDSLLSAALIYSATRPLWRVPISFFITPDRRDWMRHER